MIAAERPGRRSAKLLAIDAQGTMRRLPRADLAQLFEPGDLVVTNDAATLPASLTGRHVPSSATIEARLAGGMAIGDPTRFIAILFGEGDYRTRTENRPPPPAVAT